MIQTIAEESPPIDKQMSTILACVLHRRVTKQGSYYAAFHYFSLSSAKTAVISGFLYFLYSLLDAECPLS